MDIISLGVQAGTSIFDSIFGSIDQGHWEGSNYIPGDLQSRLNEVDKLMRIRGLMPQDVDNNRIMQILETPGVWQVNIQNYLDGILQAKQNAAVVKQNVGSASDTLTNTLPQVKTFTAGIFSNPLFIIILVVGLFFILKKK